MKRISKKNTKFEIKEIYDTIVNNLVDEYLNNRNNNNVLEPLYLELASRGRIDLYQEACKHSASIIFNKIENVSTLEQPNVVRIKKFDKNLSKNQPELKDNILSNNKLALISDNVNLMIAKVKGDSMIEAGIKDGDEIIFDKKQNVKHNDIVVANVEGEYHIIRFIKNGSEIWLKPENKYYEPVKITKDIDITFLGVVKSVVHNL